MNETVMKQNLTSEELVDILASYNEVTERLQQSHDELNNEVRRLHDELASKNRQLERRKRLAALGEMAAGLAHEIRNPLGGIRLYADLLRRDLQDRNESTEIIEKIIGGVGNLNTLVTDVLAMTHSVKPKVQPSDLTAIVASAIELLGELIAQNGTAVSCQCPSELTVACDRDMIHRAMLNVIRNAVEAAAEEGNVMIDISAQKDRAVVTIADSGQGVDAQVADRMFNPFFTTKDQGTGLGLAIVHRIVEAHDGSITVASSRWGGASFTISLPLHDDQKSKETERQDRGS